ncbi:hypothetical protein CH381_31680 [Leptospira sp. mixed culture ATI2-C-A1]|nr:hypothetical protein CH381_31680 [Leptospira sp. mixed culture ATI2-C-A1]
MKTFSLILVIIYCTSLLLSAMTTSILILFKIISIDDYALKNWILSALFGLLGGSVYCLRGIYLNYSVNNNWALRWLPWYFIRPMISFVTGFFSYLFIRILLILLEAQPLENSTNLGYFLFAFIAGLNVDNFLKRLEEIAKLVWSINESRSSNQEDN